MVRPRIAVLLASVLLAADTDKFGITATSAAVFVDSIELGTRNVDDPCSAFVGVHNFDTLRTTPRPHSDCATLGLQNRSSGRAVLIDAFMLAYEPPMVLLLRILETVRQHNVQQAHQVSHVDVVATL